MPLHKTQKQPKVGNTLSSRLEKTEEELKLNPDETTKNEIHKKVVKKTVSGYSHNKIHGAPQPPSEVRVDEKSKDCHGKRRC